jgi:hypothetical protein
MAVLKSNDNTNLIISCKCGCDEGIRFQIDKDDYDMYNIMTYLNGRFYAEQCETFWQVLCKKLKKICAVIRNKDFYYSEIVMTKDDFVEFKEYVNSIEE